MERERVKYAVNRGKISWWRVRDSSGPRPPNLLRRYFPPLRRELAPSPWTDRGHHGASPGRQNALRARDNEIWALLMTARKRGASSIAGAPPYSGNAQKTEPQKGQGRRLGHLHEKAANLATVVLGRMKIDV